MAAGPSSANCNPIRTEHASFIHRTEPSPEARASSLLDALPGNSLVSKTGWVTLGTGLSALAISKELYVANEETVILVGFLIFATLVGRSIGGPYTQWADSQIEVRIGIMGWEKDRSFGMFGSHKGRNGGDEEWSRD